MDPTPSPERTRGARTALATFVAAGFVVILLAAVVGGVASTRGRATDPAAGSVVVGVPDPGGAAPGELVPLDGRVAPGARAPLPARTLEGFGAGAPVDLAAYRGRPLVVNFWATWCAPCVDEMPAFQQVFAEVGAEVAFLGIDVADGPRRAEPFAAELGITYDLARDPDRSFAQEVGVFGMPTTLFVDAQGTIVHRSTGGLTGGALREALRTHLAAAA